VPGSPAARGCEGDSLPGERKSGELRRGARADAGDRSGEERAGEGHADRLDWAALGFRLERRLWRGAARRARRGWRLLERRGMGEDRPRESAETTATGGGTGGGGGGIPGARTVAHRKAVDG